MTDKDKKDEKPSSIDGAILGCENKITEYKKQASWFLTVILMVILGVIVMTYALITSNRNADVNELLFRKAGENNLTAHKMATNYSKFVYENLVERNNLATLVHRINTEKNVDSLWKYLKRHEEYTNKLNDAADKDYNTTNRLLYKTDSLQQAIQNLTLDQKEKPSTSNTIYLALYGLFVLIFSVTTSLYRYCLKQISKIEHFYFGLLRIRIAGSNSKTGFDDCVKESLTKDAFTYEVQSSIFSKNKQIESPIQGHPVSDLSTSILNKLLESYEIKPKK